MIEKRAVYCGEIISFFDERNKLIVDTEEEGIVAVLTKPDFFISKTMSEEEGEDGIDYLILFYARYYLVFEIADAEEDNARHLVGTQFMDAVVRME